MCPATQAVVTHSPEKRKTSCQHAVSSLACIVTASRDVQAPNLNGTLIPGNAQFGNSEYEFYVVDVGPRNAQTMLLLHGRPSHPSAGHGLIRSAWQGGAAQTLWRARIRVDLQSPCCLKRFLACGTQASRTPQMCGATRCQPSCPPDIGSLRRTCVGLVRHRNLR